MKKVITVKHQQSLFDIAIEQTGSIESVMDIAELNNLSITQVLYEGQELIIDTEWLLKPAVKQQIEKQGLVLATAPKEDIEKQYIAGWDGLVCVLIDNETHEKYIGAWSSLICVKHHNGFYSGVWSGLTCVKQPMIMSRYEGGWDQLQCVKVEQTAYYEFKGAWDELVCVLIDNETNERYEAGWDELVCVKIPVIESIKNYE